MIKKIKKYLIEGGPFFIYVFLAGAADFGILAFSLWFIAFFIAVHARETEIYLKNIKDLRTEVDTIIKTLEEENQ